jgi:hypothetical protein
MADIIEKPLAPRRKTRSNPNGSRGNGIRTRSAADQSNAGPKGSTPKEIIEYVPVPVEFYGETKTGKICDIVRKKGKSLFGFIYIGEGGREVAPRIYFSFKNYIEERFSPRKGFLVEFECGEDSAGRPFASSVHLSEDGIKDAEEKEQKYLSNPENKRDPTGERRPNSKNFDDGRIVALQVTCEGKEGIQQVTANVAQSIGKLKHDAIVAFDAAIDFQVFCRVTEEVILEFT